MYEKKKCSTCQRLKPLSAFDTATKGKNAGGKKATCIACSASNSFRVHNRSKANPQGTHPLHQPKVNLTDKQKSWMVEILSKPWNKISLEI